MLAKDKEKKDAEKIAQGRFLETSTIVGAGLGQAVPSKPAGAGVKQMDEVMRFVAELPAQSAPDPAR